MALSLLWLGLVLLGALQTQAQNSTSNLIPASRLLRIPVKTGFQNEQFQGKWYVLGVAGNGFNKEKHRKLKMYTAIYKLNKDNSYNVTSTVARDQNCDHWTKIFIPNLRLGQFNLSNFEGHARFQRKIAGVVTTEHNHYAILHFKRIYNKQEYTKVTLYGRTKELIPEAKEIFIRFAKSLGLTDDHIIFTVIDCLAWAGASPRRRGCEDSADECLDK